MKLAFTVDHLPLRARAYRHAFKSGHGGSQGPLTQLLWRILFYGLEYADLDNGEIVATLPVRGNPRTLRLRAANRQFFALYFHKFRNGYEIEVAQSILTFLPDDGVFADLGSNWGYYPLLVASNAAFNGTVHAFEPFPATYEDLAKVVAQAGLEQWVHTHPIAIGETAGEARMTSPRHSGLARVVAGSTGTVVQVRPLDSFGWERVDVVKVDVEGQEAAVLRGARETLARCRPVVIFENNLADGVAAEEPLKLLMAFGYDIFHPEYDQRYALRRVLDGSRAEFPAYTNLIAVPSERAAELADRFEA